MPFCAIIFYISTYVQHPPKADKSHSVFYSIYRFKRHTLRIPIIHKQWKLENSFMAVVSKRREDGRMARRKIGLICYCWIETCKSWLITFNH